MERFADHLRRFFSTVGLGDWAGALGILLLFSALRWNSYDAPLVRDEGEYAYAAQLLVQGIAPYEHAFLQKPPMAVYSYALADAVAPHLFWAPRVLGYGFVFLTTCLVGAIARREWGPGCAFPAMWVFTPLVLLPGIEQFTASTEMFMLLPMVGTVALYVFNGETNTRAGIWFAAGFLGSVTMLYKYTSLPLLLGLFAGWTVAIVRRSSPGPGKLAWAWLSALLGAGVGALTVLGFFLAQDGGRHLWECTVRFNRYYSSSSSFGLDALRFRLTSFWTNWWIIFLLPLVLLMRRARRRWFWIGLFVAAWAGTGMSWYGHYYIMLMPFWALLIAAAIQRVAAAAGQRVWWIKKWVIRGLTGLVMLVLCWPDFAWMLRSKEQFITGKLSGYPFAESVQVGKRISDLAGPQEYVYVAGSEPQILRYAGRLSPTRFVIAYPLMIPTPFAEAHQREAIRDLQEHPPAVIVLVRSDTSWLMQPESPPKFQEYLQKLLSEEYRTVGGYVRQEDSGHWEEPLPEQDFARSSLVVFQRVKAAPAF